MLTCESDFQHGEPVFAMSDYGFSSRSCKVNSKMYVHTYHRVDERSMDDELHTDRRHAAKVWVESTSRTAENLMWRGFALGQARLDFALSESKELGSQNFIDC